MPYITINSEIQLGRNFYAIHVLNWHWLFYAFSALKCLNNKHILHSSKNMWNIKCFWKIYKSNFWQGNYLKQTFCGCSGYFCNNIVVFHYTSKQCHWLIHAHHTALTVPKINHNKSPRWYDNKLLIHVYFLDILIRNVKTVFTLNK